MFDDWWTCEFLCIKARYSSSATRMRPMKLVIFENTRDGFGARFRHLHCRTFCFPRNIPGRQDRRSASPPYLCFHHPQTSVLSSAHNKTPWHNQCQHSGWHLDHRLLRPQRGVSRIQYHKPDPAGLTIRVAFRDQHDTALSRR